MCLVEDKPMIAIPDCAGGAGVREDELVTRPGVRCLLANPEDHELRGIGFTAFSVLKNFSHSIGRAPVADASHRSLLSSFASGLIHRRIAEQRQRIVRFAQSSRKESVKYPTGAQS
jgi:hypothetical protein